MDCCCASPQFRRSAWPTTTAPRLRPARDRRSVLPRRLHLGQFEAAEPLLLAAHDQIARAQRPDDYRVQRTVEELVALYEAWHRPDDAALWRSRPAKQ